MEQTTVKNKTAKSKTVQAVNNQLNYKIERFVGDKPSGDYGTYRTIAECLKQLPYKNETDAEITRQNRFYARITHLKTGKTKYFV
jgi:hypothetical protein